MCLPTLTVGFSLIRYPLIFLFEQVAFPVSVPCVLGMMPGTVFAASEAKQNNDTLIIDEVCLSQTHMCAIK